MLELYSTAWTRYEPSHYGENIPVHTCFCRGRAQWCHQGNLSFQACPRLVLYRMWSENEPRILHTCTSTRQPLPSTAAIRVNQQKVLMSAEVKVICQTGETAGWLHGGNWCRLRGEAWRKPHHVSGKFVHGVQPLASLMAGYAEQHACWTW